jgi:hypothetical protein
VQRKRKTNEASKDSTVPAQKKQRKNKISKNVEAVVPKNKHTSDSVLQAFNAKSDYGQSFRSMNARDQDAEVVRLNKGADKGTHVAIKSKLLNVKYKQLCADKMRDYLFDTRQLLQSMLRANPPPCGLLLVSPGLTHLHLCRRMG